MEYGFGDDDGKEYGSESSSNCLFRLIGTVQNISVILKVSIVNGKLCFTQL